MRKFCCPYGHKADYGYYYFSTGHVHGAEILCLTCYRTFVAEYRSELMFGDDRIINSYAQRPLVYEKDTEMSRLQNVAEPWRGGVLEFIEKPEQRDYDARWLYNVATYG